MSDENLAKIALEVEYDDGEVMVETPWAEDLGDNLYRLRNSPFFAYGVSFGDIVKAAPRYDDDDRPYMISVVKKSGHRTVRIVLKESLKVSESSKAILDSLSNLDCGIEGTDGTKFFAINITPKSDLSSVCSFLTEHKVDWEHADPPYEELYPVDRD